MIVEPRVSVVIPTLNAEGEIGPLVESLLVQAVRPGEVLVVDSSSDDGTAAEAAAAGARVVTIARADFDHGGTRDAAVAMTSGEYVLFLTQDAVPASEGYVGELLAPMADPLVALSAGRQLPKPGARRYVQLVQGFNYPPEPNVRDESDIERLGIKAFFASDACSCYRRSALEGIGGVPHPCATNEDMLAAARFLRSGWKVAYAAGACVYHSHNLSPAEQYRRNRAVGAFLEGHAAELGVPSEVGEGGRLVGAVSARLLREGRAGELFAFGVDCAARLLGNRAGRRAARRGR